MTNDRSDFTQGSILKKLTFFMVPILGALVLQAAYGAVDLLTAIGLAAPISTAVVIVLNVGFYIYLNRKSATVFNKKS